MKRAALCLLALLLLLSGTTWVLSETVYGDDMSPSIMAGDRVWAVPSDEISAGDVVILADPLNSSTMLLRRVLAIAGQSISFKENVIRVDKRRLRAKAMGDMGTYLVTKETLWAKKPAVGTEWLVRHQAEPSSLWSADPVEVPDGHVFLLADDRDHALDSRWWGPVRTQHIRAVVRVRYGGAHTWRSKWEWMVGGPLFGE
jgi:signal peptidase I